MSATPPTADVRRPWTVGPITRTDIVRYQGASGDMNPLHHDEDYAAVAGHPSVISVGMLQAGFLASYASSWFGAEHVRRFAVRFKQQVVPGDVLTCSGTVRSESVAPDGARLFEVDLVCANQDGAVVVEGDARVEIPTTAIEP